MVAFSLSASGTANAGRPQFAGGLDARFITRNDEQSEAVIEGAFLNMRKVFSDNKADRFIAVAQIDWEDNFASLRPYQTYVQYKGPMGKWNVLAGHFILPFGLLHDFDSERLLMQTEELRNLGIKLDTGAKVFGRWGDFNYSLSASQGMGRYRLRDNDNNKLGVARAGIEQGNWSAGVSHINGRIFSKAKGKASSPYKNLAGLDATIYWGTMRLRAEIIAGKDGGRNEQAAYISVDHAISMRWELNLKYAYWKESRTIQDWAIGFSHDIWRRIIVRGTYQFGHSQEDSHEISFQFYWDIVKTL